ncbi:hypothetical protein ACQXW1_16180, partial [Lactiplantibacillus pentosus]
ISGTGNRTSSFTSTNITKTHVEYCHDSHRLPLILWILTLLSPSATSNTGFYHDLPPQEFSGV